MRGRPGAAATLLFALTAALAGCSHPAGPAPARSASSAADSPAAASASPSPGPALTTRDWPTYHRDAARTGLAPGEPPAGRLAVAWSARLDGAVYGQPLAVGSLVIAATENDSVYGLERTTGAVRWRAHVGTPVPLRRLQCGDIGPLGITGTMAYDPATGVAYAVAETSGYHHTLVGVSVTTGRVLVRRDIPTPDGHPASDQQRAALALAAGRVYVAFGGLYGDCGPYRGSVVGVPVSGRGPLVSYVVPTEREGGIWAAGGPVTGPDGTLYVSAGNAASTGGRYDGSDSVTALTPGLRRAGLFAPAIWGSDNAGDLDLGSSSPALLGNGTMLAVGKRGIGYLLSSSRLGGVGGQRAQRAICSAYGGMAVSGTTVYVPCESGGLAAFDTASRTVRWRGPAAAAGSPVLGGGAVWVPDYNAGVLYELAPATGAVRQQLRLPAALPHFASPSLSGGLALLGTRRGVVAVRGV